MRPLPGLLLSCLLFLSLFASAQTGSDNNFPPPEESPVVRAVKTQGELQIDGRLEETDWQSAQPIHDFFRREPRQGGQPKYRSEVRLLYDDRNLYVGVFCRDSLGRKGVRVQDLRRDFSWWQNDGFSVALDPQNLKRYCVAFLTTPHGNQGDLQNFNGDDSDTGWNTLWKVRTQRTEAGYSAEFAIPFKSLRYEVPADTADINWGVTFARYARREVEETVFPAVPQSFSPYRMTYAAQLKGLELPPPSANVRVQPYMLYQYDEAKGGSTSTTDSNFKLGGDVKWAVNPRTIVDLTINTDFAQAEVDRAVNNLERFNVFFPERRQFFLENSGIWSGGLQTDIRPFFSRRIGLQGEFNAAPAPIDAGLRFTQRDEKKALAGLLVRQRQTDHTATANFGVLRYLKNYGRENNVGVMLTHRADEAYGDLGMSADNNTTLTVDGLIRPKSQWSIAYLLSASHDHQTSTSGMAGRIYAGNNSNKLYFGWVTGVISEQYNPDMGFVFQKNVIWHNPGGYYIWRPKNIDWIRRWDPGLFVKYYHDADRPGNFQQASLYIFPVYIFFKDGSFIEYAFTPTWQNINFDFAPLGLSIEQGDYYYMRHTLRLNSDQSSKLSISGQFDWGRFYNGQRLTTTAGLRYAPIPHMAFTMDYEYNNLKGIGLENRDLDTHLLTGGLRLAANPRLQLSLFYQYNSFDDSGRWNARGSWEFAPLSFLYLVFNENTLEDNLINDRNFISKISYLKQF